MALPQRAGSGLVDPLLFVLAIACIGAAACFLAGPVPSTVPSSGSSGLLGPSSGGGSLVLSSTLWAAVLLMVLLMGVAFVAVRWAQGRAASRAALLRRGALALPGTAATTRSRWTPALAIVVATSVVLALLLLFTHVAATGTFALSPSAGGGGTVGPGGFGNGTGGSGSGSGSGGGSGSGAGGGSGSGSGSGGGSGSGTGGSGNGSGNGSGTGSGNGSGGSGGTSGGGTGNNSSGGSGTNGTGGTSGNASGSNGTGSGNNSTNGTSGSSSNQSSGGSGSTRGTGGSSGGSPAVGRPTSISWTVPPALLVAGAAAVIVVGAVAAQLGRKRPRRERRSRARAQDGAPIGPEKDDRLAVGEAVANARSAVERGDDPRATIVGLYVQLLDMLAPKVGDLASSTPEEIRSAHLHRLGVRPAASESLTRLFETARYSSHELGTDAAGRFRETLVTTEQDLRAGGKLA